MSSPFHLSLSLAFPIGTPSQPSHPVLSLKVGIKQGFFCPSVASSAISLVWPQEKYGSFFINSEGTEANVTGPRSQNWSRDHRVF